MNRPEGRFSVTYRVTLGPDENIHHYARDIAVEQTVEVPGDCIPDHLIEQGIVGRVESVLPRPGRQHVHEAVISYRSDITAYSIPQLLNVLFGNVSMKNNIQIVDVSFGPDLQSAFPGPAYGIEGIRKALGVYGRPLACTALKPMGLSPEELSSLAAAYARGGIDIIKDDHGIGNQAFHPFRERVALCQDAVRKANQETGRGTLYFPMVSGRYDEVEEQVRHAITQGVRGILIAPMLMGPDTLRYISQTYGLIMMAHPSFTGTHFHNRAHGITPAVLLGTLFRLMGADISIFPNAGGRFHFTPQECAELANALRRPEGPWKKSFPCPAGGMNLNRIPEIMQTYGEETVILIGGSVMQQGPDMTRGTKVYMNRVRSHSRERLEEPESNPGSSCEMPSPPLSGAVMGRLECKDFRWSRRSPEKYKGEGEFDFKEVVRHELTGRFGEMTMFDLRYFEIAPGGFSSLEKHIHEHVIIGARGQGVLVKGEEELKVCPHDIVYTAPLESHQLRNRGQEPFGFYCIVDHERDRPVKA